MGRGKLSHAASDVFKIVVFVRFKSSRPTVFKANETGFAAS